MTKYVFTTGGVLSSVGKGAVTSSVGKILQVRGFTVTVIKIDPYLNYDSGTMNPYMHGEVFVTENGGETDLDLGSYERFLNIDIEKINNITTGQVYWQVIDRERRGDFLGACVQIIPHISDEIKRRIRLVAERSKVDVVLVECGGTVGDIEALPFYEAFRQMKADEGESNTMVVHVALVPWLEATGEYKTKPLQHSVQELRRVGLPPDVIMARSRDVLPDGPLRKISLFGSVPLRNVFCSVDVESIYELPIILDKQGLGEVVCDRLRLPHTLARWDNWEQIVDTLKNPKHEVKIAMCGKYAELSDSYISINEALKHAGGAAGTRVLIDWIEAEVFEGKDNCKEQLAEHDGVLVPGGFGSRGAEGKIAAIRFARECGVPFLGICYGFQLATVEFARGVVGLEGANSTEIDEKSPHPVIDLLPEQRGVTRKGGTMRLGAYPISVKRDSLAWRLYGHEVIYERHRHRYEVNPEYWEKLTGAGLVFSGSTMDGSRIEILELPDHFFFFATQFHPEFKSRPGRPDPAYYGFVKACLEKKLGKSKPEIPVLGVDYPAAFTTLGS
ncbi:MAG: CTP synthase [Candidatus Bathyarchaeota archaeon]|nr:MAG: CTP synthase [Candidatus Bathyarchaeota archaeon]